MRRSVLAVLAYLVPTFVTGFLWHLVLFHSLYQRLEIYRPDPLIPLGLGSMLVQAVLFAWAYPRLFSTAPKEWGRNALLAGLGFAALSWSFTTLAVAAKHPMTSLPEYVALETGYTILQFLLVAPLMALAWRGAEPETIARGAGGP